MEAGWTTVPCPATNLCILIQYVNHLQGQSVIGVALKTPLEIRLGICIYETSLLHRPDDYIGLTLSCPHTFYNKIAPMLPLDQKGCETVQRKWKEAGWAPQIHNQYFQSQALVSPMKSCFISINCISLRSPQTSWKPPPMLLIWRWICFYPPRPENTAENQPTITNLKPRNFRQHYSHQ